MKMLVCIALACVLLCGCGMENSQGIIGGVVCGKECITGGLADEWVISLGTHENSTRQCVTQEEFSRIELGDYVQFNRAGEITYIKHDTGGSMLDNLADPANPLSPVSPFNPMSPFNQ